MNTNLQKDCEYSIELGDSFSQLTNSSSNNSSNSSSSNNEFHSLVYKFKPKSLKDNSWEGKIDIDTSSTIVHLNTNNSRLFKGTFESYKKPNIHECILIYDKNSNTFTLEKLHATIGALQQIDNNSSSSNNLQNLNNNNSLNNMMMNNIITETITSNYLNNNNNMNNSNNLNNNNNNLNSNMNSTMMRSNSSSSTTQLLNSTVSSKTTTPPKRSLTPSSSTHSLDIELPKKKLKDSPPTFNPTFMTSNNNMTNMINSNMTNSNNNSNSTKGCELISKMNNLTHLELNSTGVTGDGIQYFQHLNKLSILGITGEKWEIKDEHNIKDISYLSNLKKLTFLDLFRTDIVNQDLIHISKLSHLKYLKLDWITFEGIKHLINLTNLKELKLIDSEIGEKGIKIICEKFPCLSNLNLADVTTGVYGDKSQGGLWLSSLVDISHEDDIYLIDYFLMNKLKRKMKWTESTFWSLKVLTFVTNDYKAASDKSIAKPVISGMLEEEGQPLKEI
ncbi:predicted protein [Naegleria gruberi]|uniref:Predicted protein n=1 Tax=Naegleria gruberi TaxID=5762 RepID=D2W4J3_NAEGR|nr:uncharacterized protein NAEGRDRAFT_76327 [Naegleria gruberi]EFC36005.1 predicted protein [Naegleria gruberi]|eukprot:XP_002668749.1 predicted protein [Naegleria gruberi strain NEG-M]